MWGAGSEWTGKRGGTGKGKNKNDQEAGSEAVSDRTGQDRASNWTTQRSVSVQSADGSKAKFRRESKTIQTPGR